jgi:hypothetical protein
VDHADFGGNQIGINLSGTAGAAKSHGWQVVNTQFGNQFKQDIFVNGYDVAGADFVSTGNTIVGNRFNQSGNRTANTYAAIDLQDGGANSILGNIFESDSIHSTKTAIFAHETNSARVVANYVAGNASFGPAFFPGGIYTDSTTNGAIGLQVPIKGGSTSSLDLFDVTAAAATPHKFFRVSGGTLQILNSAFGALIFTLSDAGALTAQTSISAPTVSSTSGKVIGAGGVSPESAAQVTWTSGAGVPSAGACTASTLGALYSNKSGGATTSLYVCTAAGVWTAK